MGDIKEDLRKRAKKYAGGVGVLDYIEIKGIDYTFYPYVENLNNQLTQKDKQIELLLECVEDAIEYIDHYGGQWKHEQLTSKLEKYKEMLSGAIEK